MAFIYVLLLFLGLASYATSVEVTDDIIGRLTRLEDTEREHKQEISALKEKMQGMEDSFLRKEKEMILKIDALRNRCEENEEFVQTHKKQDLKKRTSLKEVRDVVETEVAFYATHSNHDIRHLGVSQIIPFNQTVTNIGNAYNTHHGAFTAPVDGTYVFHVTLMGTLHNAADHYYAYIDVDDVGYSKLWMVPYDQSSHMFVIELKSGNVVSVRNGHIEDGVVGQHFSAFSGFLLYQHNHEPAIVG